MNPSRDAKVCRAILCALLLAGCEATTLPAEPSAPVEPQAAALQATSSYNNLRLRTGTAVAQGSTCGAANEVSSTCGSSGTAPDLHYRWMAPYSGEYVISTQGSAYDTVLQLSQWGNGVSLGCNDNTAGTLQSAVSVYLAKDTVIRITVDGASGKCGEFQLNITPLVGCAGQSCCPDGHTACGAVCCNDFSEACDFESNTCMYIFP